MKLLAQRWPFAARRKSWLIAAGVVVAFIAALAPFDAQISQLGRSLPAPVIEVFAFITRFGETTWILVPAFVLWLLSTLGAFLIPKRPARLALWQMAGIWGFIFIGVGLPDLFTGVIKRLVGRGRPDLVDSPGPFTFLPGGGLEWGYHSFPSGHTTTAFAICFVVSFLARRWFPAMLVFAVTVALSRIVLGAHYPTDLVGGAIVGTLGAYLVRDLFAGRRWVFDTLPNNTITTRSLLAARLVAAR